MLSPYSRCRLRWTTALHELCGIERATAAYPEIELRYAEPHRHYHTLDHVSDVLEALQDITGQPRFPVPALVLAGFLHDIIYDPRASDNEERSAAFACALLGGIGVGMTTCEETARLILLTKTHHTTPDDAPGLALLDADLGILGAEPDVYDEYAAAIRREYAWVPEEDYRTGRAQVLERFLARPCLYHTEAFQPRQAQARANLDREIRRLS